MKNILIIGMMVCALCSCNTFLKEYSQGLARVETVSDLDELLLGGAYHPTAYYYEQNWTAYLDGTPLNIFVNFMSDELRQNDTTRGGDPYGVMRSMFGYFTWQRDVGINPLGTSISAEDTDWTKIYGYINVVNMVIDELKEVDAITDEDIVDKIRVEGEAYFLRALYYFQLVNLYAKPYTPSEAATTTGIPLKLTSYVEDKEYTCSSVAVVYEQIIRDLERAESCLLETPRKSVYRADINATYLLMSRAYLYMQDYPNAKKYAQLVLDRNNYLTDLRTFDGIDNVFTADNGEVLFSMGGHLLSNYMYGTDDTPENYPFYVSEDLANAFASDDLRKRLYICETPGYGYTYKKIYWGQAHYGSPCTVSDNFLFRTSEAYLNLAEAAAFDNDETTARQMLGELQAKRFNTAPTITASGNALIDLIRKERQRELCLEGHRWFDLRRYMACEAYPWTKTITHPYTDFSDGDQTPARKRIFELPPNDEAYTLAFPREVLDFQSSLNTNNRPDRQPVSSEEFEE